MLRPPQPQRPTLTVSLPTRPPRPPAAWHCLACYGVHTMNPLLAHKERQRLSAQLRAQRPSLDGGKPLRRPVHSSASSLPSYGSGKPGGWSPGIASP